MRSEANAKKWLGHVESWQKSNVTQSEYCRLNKLCVKSFSNWKLKCAKESHKSSEPEIPVFTSPQTVVPLISVAISEHMESATETKAKAPQKSNPDFSGVTLIIKNDYQISLAIGFNPKTLKNVLAVLAE